jgi:hypothetical protein
MSAISRREAEYEEEMGMCDVRRALIAIISGIVFLPMFCLQAGALGERETAAIRDISGFEGVSFATAGKLIITQGDREALEIEALSSDLPNIAAEVREGTLFIARKGAEPFLPFRAPVFRLTVRNIAALESHGSGRISLSGLNTDSLRIVISSSGNIIIDSLTADSFDVRISSSGSVRAAGDVNRQNVVLTSSGGYAGGQLASRSAVVRVSSSGSATLRVSESLDAVVTSSGNLRYYGNPGVRKVSATSSGRVVRLGD